MSESEIMTIEDVAKFLRVSEKTVYDWAQKGEIPGGKLGNNWRFSRKEIERWVSQKLKGRSRLEAPPVPVSRVLTPERVTLLDTTRKSDALQALIDLLAESPQVKDRDALARAVWQREELMSTGIGLGIAVPHVRLASVTDLVMAVGVSKAGVKDYESLDGQPVHIIFLIAARDDQHAEYLRLLAAISSRAKDPLTRQRLLDAEDTEAIYAALTEDE